MSRGAIDMKRLDGSKDLRSRGEALLFLGLILLSCPRAAHAYLDPGSGSYLFQLAVAGVFGALYTLKTYWRQVRARLLRRPSDPE